MKTTGFPRPFAFTNYLPISSESDGAIDSLEEKFYNNLSDGLVNYIFDIKIPYNSSILKPDKHSRRTYNEVAAHVYFIEKSTLHRKLWKFLEEYIPPTSGRSRTELKTFFYTIFANANHRNDIQKEALLSILRDSKTELEQQMKSLTEGNIFAYLDINTFISRDYGKNFLLSEYGWRVAVGGRKPLRSILKVNDTTLLDIITPSGRRDISKQDQKTRILRDIMVTEEMPIHEYVLTSVYEAYKNHSDPGIKITSTEDFDNYIKFIKERGTSRNDFVNELLRLKPNETIMPRASNLLYDIDSVSDERRGVIFIYQDLEVLRAVSASAMRNPVSENMMRMLYWHVERLVESQI
jgi:hypothetical protein